MGEYAIIMASLHKNFLFGLGIRKAEHWEFFLAFGFFTVNIELKKKTEKNKWFEFHLA